MTTHYISSNSDLETCISCFQSTREIAVDLEFDKNRYRYGFNLCLIQIYAQSKCYLIDPLSDELNVELLFPVLEDSEIQKVVFAFGEDLRLLHSLGCFPRNLFEIRIAAGLLNHPPVSLDKILHTVLDLEECSSSQTSNWYKRPLSLKQQRYAARDVAHLIALKNVLLEEADSKKISSWIREENSLLEHVDYSEEEESRILKDKDKKGLTELEWYLFKQMMLYREQLARDLNRPNHHIVRKEQLLEIARDPEKICNWESMKGIHRRLKQEHFTAQWKNLVRQSLQQARQKGYSATEPAVKPLSREEHQSRKKDRTRTNQIKNHLFAPIKNRIAEEYGQHTAAFLLSNRTVKKIIAGENSPVSYKKSLLLNYAEELDRDVDLLLRMVG